MGRGRYNARDHWHQHDEDGYEAHPIDRYTNDATSEDSYIYEDEDEIRPSRRRASDSPYPPPHMRRTRRTRNIRPPANEPSPRYQRRPQRKRSVWPALLGGCALGVFLVVLAAALVVVFAIHNLQNGGTIANIPGMISMKSFSKDEAQELPLSQVSQILVCDQVGNVTLRVDPTLNKPAVTTKKTVRALNQADANKALQQIIIEVQPPSTITHPLTCARSQVMPTSTTSATNTTNAPIIPTTLAANPSTATNSADNTTLTINVLFPNTNSFEHSVDLNIAFPPAVLSNANGPSTSVDVEAPIGDINVDGLSGVLNIRGGTGNVTVKHAILVDGSHIETAQGNVTFNGFLAAPQTDNGKGAQYIIQSEHNVDVTLPGNTNVILDANTNVGKISSDFPINVTNANGAMSYNGPLNTTASTQSSSTLVLDVSTGNVTIHRSQI